MQTSIAVNVCALILILGSGTLYAQTPNASGPNNSEVIKELEALRKDVQDIKSLLQTQQMMLPQGATRSQTPVPLPENEVTLPFIPNQGMGSLSSKFVVVEFADLQCPYCSYFQKNTFADFKSKYVDNGTVRFLSQDFPLEMHPDAAKMSMASICAGEQGKYWEMRSALVLAGNLANSQLLNNTADSLLLDNSRFLPCLSSSDKLRTLKDQSAQARAIGISGTPTFLVGVISGSKIRGVLLVGAVSSTELGRIIDQVIAKERDGSSNVNTKSKNSL